ncbi:heavy metal-binding domain-containing protein [Synergistaceae bacterium OttesenSCG-928-I11]|nr:heavy metal-binding domain-containing protein [Synergistaceae bacterium OttesenSCG-928-I11]
MLITTLEPHDKEVQYMGIIYATSCFSKSLPHDLFANLKNWSVGGNLNTYSNMMSEGMSIAIDRLKEEAEKIGADAIYGFRVATPSVSAGAAEIIAYGTAVKYVRED